MCLFNYSLGLVRLYCVPPPCVSPAWLANPLLTEVRHKGKTLPLLSIFKNMGAKGFALDSQFDKKQQILYYVSTSLIHNKTN